MLIRFIGAGRQDAAGCLSPSLVKLKKQTVIQNSNSSVVDSLCSPLLRGGDRGGGPVTPGPPLSPPFLAAAPPLAPLSPFSLPHIAGRGSPNKGEHMCVVIPILAHVFTIHGVPRRPRRVPGVGGGGVWCGGWRVVLMCWPHDDSRIVPMPWVQTK